MNALKILGPLVVIAACIGYLFVSEQASGPKRDPVQMIREGGLLLDVRTPEEYGAGHIPQAINIPEGQLGRRTDELGAKDRPIVVYCASGKRSRWAYETLQRAGFTNVYDMGPMSAWPN